MVEFDERAIASHRVARLNFVPWLARFFGGGPIKQRSPELSVGDANALTEETVQAIQDIANLTCWRYLVRECGWRKLHAVSALSSDQYSYRRMLQEGDVLPKLTFTTATPDLLITLFNATGRAQSITNIDMPDCLSTNGDLIIHHLVFRRLFFESKSFGIDAGHRWLQWYPNPLNACLDPLGYHGDGSVNVKWQQLFSAEMLPFMPWVSETLFLQINDRIPALWSEGRETETSAWLEGFAQLANQWIDSVQSINRPDLQCCFFDLMIQHSKQSTEILSRFNAVNRRQTIQMRQSRGELWNQFIELSNCLDATAQSCLGVHPIERNAVHKCFLARWQFAKFEHSVKQLRELSQTLRPIFN